MLDMKGKKWAAEQPMKQPRRKHSCIKVRLVSFATGPFFLPALLLLLLPLKEENRKENFSSHQCFSCWLNRLRLIIARSYLTSLIRLSTHNQIIWNEVTFNFCCVRWTGDLLSFKFLYFGLSLSGLCAPNGAWIWSKQLCRGSHACNNFYNWMHTSFAVSLSPYELHTVHLSIYSIQATVNGRKGVIVAGGLSAAIPALSSVEFFDLGERRWLSLGRMRRGRRFPGIFVLRGNLVIAGGETTELRGRQNPSVFESGLGSFFGGGGFGGARTPVNPTAVENNVILDDMETLRDRSWRPVKQKLGEPRSRFGLARIPKTFF